MKNPSFITIFLPALVFAVRTGGMWTITQNGK